MKCAGQSMRKRTPLSARRGGICLALSLYLVGREGNGNLIEKSSSCTMCKRLVINAGITTIIIRDTEDSFREIPVTQWIEQDDSLTDQMGY